MTRAPGAGPGRPARRWSVAKVVLATAIAVGVALFVGFIATLVVNAIWPGEAKLFDGRICPATHPDMFIVHETYGTADGSTAVEDTVACLDSRGDVVERSYGYVIWRLGLLHSGITFVLLVVAAVLLDRRSTRRRSRP